MTTGATHRSHPQDPLTSRDTPNTNVIFRFCCMWVFGFPPKILKNLIEGLCWHRLFYLCPVRRVIPAESLPNISTTREKYEVLFHDFRENFNYHLCYRQPFLAGLWISCLYWQKWPIFHLFLKCLFLFTKTSKGWFQSKISWGMSMSCPPFLYLTFVDPLWSKKRAQIRQNWPDLPWSKLK